MKKTTLIVPILCLLGCTGTLQESQPDMSYYAQKAIDNLKERSQECRKYDLVLRGVVEAHNAEKEGRYYSVTTMQCLALAYYEMSYVDINFITESSGKYFENNVLSILGACSDILSGTKGKDKDEISLYFASETEKTILPYLKKHFVECMEADLEKEINQNNQKE